MPSAGKIYKLIDIIAFMEITDKQKSEIEFYSKIYVKEPFTPTKKEIEEYLLITVYGKISGDRRSKNRLYQRKRMFEIIFNYWKKDIPNLITIDEIREDFNHPYLEKKLKTLVLHSKN